MSNALHDSSFCGSLLNELRCPWFRKLHVKERVYNVQHLEYGLVYCIIKCFPHLLASLSILIACEKYWLWTSDYVLTGKQTILTCPAALNLWEIRNSMEKKNINVDFLLRFDNEGTSFLSWAKQLLHMFGSCSCLLQTKRAHGTLINSCPRHRHKTYNCFHSNQTQLRDIVGVWKKHFSYVLPRRLRQLVITVKVHLPLKRFIGSAGTFFTLLIDP